MIGCDDMSLISIFTLMMRMKHPQSTQSRVLEDQNNQGKTVVTMLSNEEQNHQEIIIISDDDMEEEDSPMIEGGETIQRITYRQRRYATSYKLTLFDDLKLVEQVRTYIHSSQIWKGIVAEFSPRSGDSCRVRWTKLLRCDDIYVQDRWSELANYLTITREVLTSPWS